MSKTMGNLLEQELVERPKQQENILKPLLVGELLQQVDNDPKYRFFIPSYQRGYRWDKTQVTDLLDDLYEFITSSTSRDQKYCLQPIVVKQLTDGRYEVLDGQQRLTTIFILLSRLKQNNSEIDLFSIEYETRPNSAEFLRNLIEEVNNENPDYYYISNAYITIAGWLKETKSKKISISTELYIALANSIEFIWYEIKNEQDAIEIFTRINIGKIPLTNSELVKAVFLSKNNLSIGYASSEKEDKDFSKILTLKQNAIALEWYQIEKILQEPTFWGFIYNGSEQLETRIDYLLDLSAHKSSNHSNKYFSFKYFYDKVQNVRNNKPLQEDYAKKSYSFIEEEWNNLKTIFDILQEWFQDKKFNHLIGYLIHEGEDIVKIIDEFKKNNRDAFLDVIKDMIKKKIDCTDISLLRYYNSGDKNKLGKILLLHNVVNSLHTVDSNIYFPFEKMKNKSWTLEHIFAQNSDELREEDYEGWLKDHLSFFQAKSDDDKACEIVKAINILLQSENSSIEKEEFQECFLTVANYIQEEINKIDNAEAFLDDTEDVENLVIAEDEYNWINNDHSIANLALLDGSINSAIKNSLFDIKRRLILEKDKEGRFIPNETKKVFLKYYTSVPNHLAYWTFEDRKAYVKSIKSTLNFLN